MKKTMWLAVIACGVALTAWAEGDLLKAAIGNPCINGAVPATEAETDGCVSTNPPCEDLVNPLYESMVPVTMSPILCDRPLMPTFFVTDAAKVLIVLTDVGVKGETPDDDCGIKDETPDEDVGIQDETPDEDIGIMGETPDE